MTADHRSIAHAYQTEGLTLQQCAARFKCAVGSVRYALEKHGVNPRSRGYRSTRREAGPVPQENKQVFTKGSLDFRNGPDKRPAQTAIQQMAIQACARLGGIAQIDDRYIIVDTTRFKIEERVDENIV